MGIISKYGPKILADAYSYNAKLLMAAHGYPNGTLTKHLLLSGVQGNGKTLFAETLANNMAPNMSPSDIHFIDVSADTSINCIRSLKNQMGFVPFNSRGIRVVILDEVDCFSAPASEALKGLMTEWPSTDSGVFFILTTNHKGALSAPVVDRCLCIDLPPTRVEDVLPAAKEILTGEGIPFDEATLLASLTKDTSGLCTYRYMQGIVEQIITMRDIQP